MSQLDKLRALLVSYDVGRLRALTTALEGVLAAAQNPAEHGGAADGTVDPETWQRGREACDAATRLARAVEAAFADAPRSGSACEDCGAAPPVVRVVSRSCDACCRQRTEWLRGFAHHPNPKQCALYGCKECDEKSGS